MMETVNSKKQKLQIQDIIMSAVKRDHPDLKGVNLAGALIAITEELKLPNSEAIQFGNTLFITHFNKERNAGVMRALNMDTAPNYIKNGELYTRYLIQKGIKYFMTTYNTESFGIPFRQIEKNHLGQVLTLKTKNGWQTHVLLTIPKNKAKRNAEA